MRLFRASIDDVPSILECAREFCAVLPDCPLDEKHYSMVWKNFFQSGTGAIFLLEKGGVVVGGIGGIISPDLLTGFMSAVELFWYVKPEFRGGTWPVRLLREFEKWAGDNHCLHASMIHMEASMPERLKSFYLRSGYELLETVYRKRLSHAEKVRIQ